MSTLATRISRALLASAAAVSLLAACGGDDDEPTGSTTTTTEAPDGSTDSGTDENADGAICDRLELAALNRVTGEEFVDAEPQGDDSCQYSNADGSALIQLGIATLGEDDDFLGDAEEGCDAGTFTETDVDGADAAFACVVNGAPTIATADGDEVTLLIGLSLDPEVSHDMILGALRELIGEVA